MIKELDSYETKLEGSHIYKNGTIVADEVSKRIEFLTQNKLKKLRLLMKAGNNYILMQKTLGIGNYLTLRVTLMAAEHHC